MWLKKLDVEELDISFLPREIDPLDGKRNPYDNMVEDEEEFEEAQIELHQDPRKE